MRHHSVKVTKPSCENPLEPSRLLQEAVLPPRRPRHDYVYASLFWDKKLKPIFDASKEMLDLVGMETPTLVLRNQIVRELYRQESQEVLDMVENEVRERHEAATAAFNAYVAEEPTASQVAE